MNKKRAPIRMYQTSDSGKRHFGKNPYITHTSANPMYYHSSYAYEYISRWYQPGVPWARAVWKSQGDPYLCSRGSWAESWGSAVFMWGCSIHVEKRTQKYEIWRSYSFGMMMMVMMMMMMMTTTTTTTTTTTSSETISYMFLLSGGQVSALWLLSFFRKMPSQNS